MATTLSTSLSTSLATSLADDTPIFDFVATGLVMEESDEDWFYNITALPGASALFDEDGNPVKQSINISVHGTYGDTAFGLTCVMDWHQEYNEFEGPNPIPTSTNPSQIYYGLGNVYFTLLK